MPPLLLLLACRPPSVPPADDGRGNTSVADPCPDRGAPALATDVWAQAGPLPATGLHTFATDGGAPIWVASHSTGVWRAWDDLAWDDLVVGVTHTISEIALRPGNPDHAFRSAGGTVERTRDAGVGWDRLDLGAVVPGAPVDEVWALAVTPWAPDRVLAVQESGAASISTDDGDTWVNVGYAPIHEPPTADDPFQVWGWRVLPEVAEGGRVVFGDGFGVAVSDDGMQTWTRTLDTPLGGSSLMRDPLDPTHVVVGGPAGLHVSTDEGRTWTLHDLGGDVLTGAWARDGSWLALVGSDKVFVSDDAGATFTAVDHALGTLAGAAILDDGRLLVAGHHGVYASADRGASWVDVSAGLEDRGVSVVVVDPACPARVYAGSRCGGGLFLSEDYGETWAPVHHYLHYVMGLVWQGDRLWAVSDDRLLRSDDRGLTWEEAWRRYHFHGFAVGDTLLLGSVGGGTWADATMRVYRSEDGGETWVDSSAGLPETDASAHALLRWPDAPDVVLLGTYKGGDLSHRTGVGVGLWRSTDDGASWTRAELDVADVAALAAHDGAVFAATGEGIWRSTDEGHTWTQAAGPAGEMLAVGFGGGVGLALDAAGTLWRSDDGERWVEHDEGLARNPTSTLAQVAVSADGAVAYVTVFDEGVWRIGL